MLHNKANKLVCITRGISMFSFGQFAQSIK
jgi:hypothetical protein